MTATISNPTVTRVFINGNSQAVRIPKEFHLDCSQVTISSDGHSITLTPLSTSWADFFAAEGAAPEAFMDFDRDELPQERALFDAHS